ncbi:MAG: isocitrate lyase/phosphoenolpyruvate mutase family protein [Microbacteriaceae bacterium]|nr:MAG: isocitrate lyase/phosphoenolpyruvate mutase family protein [Microbacteriaceae bacterium]
MPSPASATSLSERFLALHHGATPLLLPNPWDVGSARLFAAMGFHALATTSSGFAASVGRLDGQVTRDEALAHAAEIVRATTLPVSADLENGFGADLAAVADSYTLAAQSGLAGGSIEDSADDPDAPVLDIGAAADRVRAAAEAAHGVDPQFVLTGRAENYFHERPDLADTIRRLQAYQEAGADVLYAPGVTRAEDIRSIVTSVDRPVNVLARPTALTVAELGALGVARISVGGAFAFAAFGAAAEAAREFLADGTYGFAAQSRAGSEAVVAAFGDA